MQSFPAGQANFAEHLVETEACLMRAVSLCHRDDRSRHLALRLGPDQFSPMEHGIYVGVRLAEGEAQLMRIKWARTLARGAGARAA